MTHESKIILNGWFSDYNDCAVAGKLIWYLVFENCQFLEAFRSAEKKKRRGYDSTQFFCNPSLRRVTFIPHFSSTWDREKRQFEKRVKELRKENDKLKDWSCPTLLVLISELVSFRSWKLCKSWIDSAETLQLGHEVDVQVLEYEQIHVNQHEWRGSISSGVRIPEWSPDLSTHLIKSAERSLSCSLITKVVIHCGAWNESHSSTFPLLSPYVAREQRVIIRFLFREGVEPHNIHTRLSAQFRDAGDTLRTVQRSYPVDWL
jgi:hypothetical protein